MKTQGLFHVAIKTGDLDATIKFYSDILGLEQAPRPDFGFPGAWLGVPGEAAIIHIYAGGPARDANGRVPHGTGSLDHVSLTVSGWDECLARVKARGLDWRAQVIPSINLWQIFVFDPSGVMLELTFDGNKENRPVPELAAERIYMSGKPFHATRVAEAVG
jgi:catechol 2,3-dioxygenase-like lactoylglutathione lyase family enzyme